MKRIKISYKELYKRLNIDSEVTEETLYRNEYKIRIKNNKNFINIEAFVKKPKAKIIKLNLEDYMETKCAENHIFIDKDGNEVFAKDATEIQTIFGIKKVISRELYSYDEVYDIALAAPHLYTTTNGVIHHNTKVGDAFMKYLLDATDVDLVEKRKVIDSYTDDEGNTYEIDIATKEAEGVKVAYVKNEDILADDLFWNSLREEEFHLVFLDDLDYSLLPRTQNISTSEDIQKNKFISNLLSFTDGIFESGNKTKFIITTNRPVSDIDVAVLRKGRTFDILELRELNRDEAEKIWLENELSSDEFNKEFPNNDRILQADLGSSISMTLKAKKEKIDLKPYIKEEGISIYNSIKTPQKIGL